jgi:hypothetical protein
MEDQQLKSGAPGNLNPLRETIRRMAESNYRHKNKVVETGSLVKYMRIEPGTRECRHWG